MDQGLSSHIKDGSPISQRELSSLQRLNGFGSERENSNHQRQKRANPNPEQQEKKDPLKCVPPSFEIDFDGSCKLKPIVQLSHSISDFPSSLHFSSKSIEIPSFLISAHPNSHQPPSLHLNRQLFLFEIIRKLIMFVFQSKLPSNLGKLICFELFGDWEEEVRIQEVYNHQHIIVFSFSRQDSKDQSVPFRFFLNASFTCRSRSATGSMMQATSSISAASSILQLTSSMQLILPLDAAASPKISPDPCSRSASLLIRFFLLRSIFDSSKDKIKLTGIEKYKEISASYRCVAHSAATETLGRCRLDRHAHVHFNKFARQPAVVELQEGRAEHLALAEGEDVLPLPAFVVSAPDVLVSHVVLEGLLCEVFFEDLALRAEYPRDHLRVLVGDLLLVELLEAPVLVHHALGLGQLRLLDLPPFEETGAVGLVVA